MHACMGDSPNERWDVGVEEGKVRLKHGGICLHGHYSVSNGVAHCVPQLVHLRLMHAN